MANTIIPKRSSVVAKVPLPGDLQVGELAINLADGLLFSKNAAGIVIQLGGGGSGLPLTGGTMTGTFINTKTGLATWGEAQILLNGATMNRIDWNQNGSNDPTFTTRSAGAKLVLFPALDGSNTDHAIGISNSTSWFGVPNASNQWKWFAGTTAVATLSGAGSLALASGLSFNAALGIGAPGSQSYGTVGQVLTSAGPSAVPTWTTPSGGGGAATVSVSDAAPSSPAANSLWWDSAIGQLRIYYNDGDTSQWVDAVNTQGIPGTNGLDGVDGVDGVGVPTGGTVGQVLIKNSATNYDTAWSNLLPSGFGSQAANLVLAAPNNAAGNPTFRNLSLEDLPDAWLKKAVKVATTTNITLSGTQTIDGIAVVAGDRVLVKNQTTTANNGIYIVAAGAWTRSLDADTASEVAGAMVAVDQGTVNGGKTYDCDFKSTDTLGTTAVTWHRMVDDSSADLYYRKNTGTVLAGTTVAQSWLGLPSGGVVVAANTIYEFEGSFRMTTTGTSTHTERILFGLTTATVTNIDYSVNRDTNSATATAGQTNRATAVAGVVVTGNITTAQDVTYFIKGSVAFGTGGSFSPQIQFSAGPGGTSTVLLGAMFRMKPIGTTGSNAFNGTWA